MQRTIRTLARLLVTSTILVTLVGAMALAGTAKVREGRWALPTRGDIQALAGSLLPKESPTPRYIYLVRDAFEVAHGPDDALRGTSSLLPPNTRAHIPRYRGSKASWNRLVRCIQGQFEAYDVIVSDEPPAEGQEMVLVKIGGKPGDIGMGERKIGGVAPFHGGVLGNSIAFVFDAGGKRRTLTNCETAAHEIGHVYGLDHTMNCKDMMSYERCGKKTFIAEPMACGETDARECERGGVQNSHDHLHGLLGAPLKE